MVVPEWDGFPYYITPERGFLAKVNLQDEPFASPYQFATIDSDDFKQKIISCLKKRDRVESILPNWAYYDFTIQQIKELVNDMLNKSVEKKFFNRLKKELINKSLFSSGINEFLQFYEINNTEDLIIKNNEQAFTNEFRQGGKKILKILHHEIFNSMSSFKEKVDDSKKREVVI